MLVKRAARLEQLNDVDSLWHGTVETLAVAGFDHAIYLTVNAAMQAPFLRCTLPGLYDRDPPEEDPFLCHACKTYDILPLGSEFIDGHPYITDRERAFVERAGAAGITAGLGIPMRLQGMERFGGFIVGTGLDRATFTERILPRSEEIRLFCLLIHRRIEELTAETGPPETYETDPDDFRSPLLAPALPPQFQDLSPREREIVYLLAHGHSRHDTAKICGISVHTVSDYAKSGYRKLGVHNRAQAAAILYESPSPLDD